MRFRNEARLVLLTLAFAGLALACGEDAEVAPSQAPPVATVAIGAVDLEEKIQASGELQSRLQTTIAAEVSGRVTEVALREGDRAVAGQVVLEIDPARRSLELVAAQAAVARAEATLEMKTRETARVRTLHGNNVASKSKLDAAETELKLARANLAAERAQQGVSKRALADASVSAPFEGLIGRRLVNPGQFVQAGTPLFELVSLDPVDVVFHLAEIDSGRVHVGQKVAVSVAPYPGRTFAATVDVISPTIDSDTRTLRVKARLANPEGTLRPGLFARADLGVAVRRNVLIVPEEAVLQRSDGAVVFTVEDGVARRHVVRTGSFHEGGVEIVEGLAAGAHVITRGQTGLIDGTPVRSVLPASSGAGIASMVDVARDAL